MYIKLITTVKLWQTIAIRSSVVILNPYQCHVSIIMTSYSSLLYAVWNVICDHDPTISWDSVLNLYNATLSTAACSTIQFHIVNFMIYCVFLHYNYILYTQGNVCHYLFNFISSATVRVHIYNKMVPKIACIVLLYCFTTCIAERAFIPGCGKHYFYHVHK